MNEFSKVLLATDNAYTVLQKALDCGPGLGGLNVCEVVWICTRMRQQ